VKRRAFPGTALAGLPIAGAFAAQPNTGTMLESWKKRA
jgi:hypothetical protein